ncbi:hypothetical protein CEXT_505801 [Caerostris extrusa]|uniref:Uncharacterized protein n=1 Tax=Caerostris extrusa TaxID=172846 RepID=A0AAV4MFJ0_CAEEX|nr:hypothetical protein CEXT_505801 [Caerostris extrusa]
MIPASKRETAALGIDATFRTWKRSYLKACVLHPRTPSRPSFPFSMSLFLFYLPRIRNKANSGHWRTTNIYGSVPSRMERMDGQSFGRHSPLTPLLLEHPFSLLYSPPDQGMCNICLLREIALGQEGRLNFSSVSNSKWS